MSSSPDIAGESGDASAIAPIGNRHDTVVIGGGIAGCAATYYLARAGADVALLEQFDLNTQASGRNAGSLHGQIQHSPFVERGEAWAEMFLPALSFLVDSVELWRTLATELAADLEVKIGGGLLVAATASQLLDIERKVRIERAAGLTSEVIGKSDLRRIAPYISEAMVGAEFSPSEGVANPLLAAPAFAKAAQRHGAAIRTNTRVLHIHRDQGRLRVVTTTGTVLCRRIIVAAGSGIGHLSSLFGKTLPIEDEAIQLSVTEPVERFVNHLVYFAGGALTFKQATAGSLLIGGGWPASQDAVTGAVSVNPQSLRDNLRVAQTVAPAIGRVRVIRAWTGVARRTPDLMPIIGNLGDSSDVFVGIFPHLGLTAGPLLGKTLADLALGQTGDRDLAPFSPDRF